MTNNYIEEAIREAVENGFKRPEPCELDGIQFYHKGDTFLDPLFWQALGKARGWGTYDKGTKTSSGNNEIGETALLNWHRFIEHLWTQKPAEEFFSTLK